MKKAFSILLSLCILSGVFAGATASVSANDYVLYDADSKVVIDHIIYSKVEISDDKASDYYMVDKFFDSDEYAIKATEINILSEVNGLPVKVIGAMPKDKLNQGENVEKISLPDTIIEIGEYAFSGFRNLKNITLPDSLETIRPFAFNYMTSLESITVPEKITVIEEGVFARCENLKKVKFEGRITKIMDSAFSMCTSLKSIDLSDTLEQIGEAAFACSGLESIKIPADIYPAQYAFGDCLLLKKVVFTGNVGKNGKFGIYDELFFGCKNLEKVYLPKSAKEIDIGSYAFYNCKSLKKIYNTSKICGIGNNAFENCKSLTSFTIPKKIKSIEAETFKGCKSLKKVVFNGKKTVKIGKDVFKNTKKGIKLIVKNKALAKKLKTNIKSKGVRKAKIYVGKKLVYKNVK